MKYNLYKKMNHYALYLKLIYYCKSTILQLKNNEVWHKGKKKVGYYE